ncbi:transcriptional regulator, MarR family [Desulfatibacillum aliphaticivorans]|uniref:Transcriptional regulator, MarR family n=1 Tax=Desulfatibacillum aliphaticivorans TaxID=218208 RepID=B8FJZ4_DESAL|nr:winged helix-turn-helix transcriptional regulator [Desulfatibacillum aliphaticivorans]ACL02422.1 transcriptional regulator, MarR family [Desulfatibacillum aliphaticivorans]
MDTQDIRTLKILEEIENGQAPSQRDLAGKLDVSLGLVNSFIKRLTQKGYFKVTTIPRNRVKYILTPKGAAEKARLTYEFIQYSFTFYKRVRENTGKFFKELEARGVKTAAFCGAGELAEIAYVSLQETSISLVCIIDDQCSKSRVLGVPVRPLGQAESLGCEHYLITAPESASKIRGFLEDAGIAADKIFLVNSSGRIE